MTYGHNEAVGAEQRLLNALAEQLKMPLLHIAHRAELHDAAALQAIEVTAAQALRLIDTYLFSVQQQTLELEPVSVSSVLYEAAQTLEPLAQQYGGRLELAVDGKYGPVMAHPRGLIAALVSLGQSLLEADESERPQLTLSVYRHKNIIQTGIFSGQAGLSADMLRRALRLYGTVRQPMPTGSSLNGAGVYVAETIFRQMSARLHVARHRNLTGLAAGLLPSAQLQLV